MRVLPVETLSMHTRDGVRLDADIYRPEGDGPWPVLLLRQAYGRRVASTVSYAHPRWYAAQGYVVAVQDVRGRGTSEGFFETLEHEAEDGADAVAWCAALPGTTGAVGMYGFSYQGMNQILAASLAGPELKAVAPAMIGWDLRGEMAREGGIPQLAGGIGWAAQVGADTARHQRDAEAHEALRAAANNLPLGDAITAQPEVMTRYAHLHHYYRWLEAGEGDPLWQRIAPMARLDTLIAKRTPALFVGGWYDFTLPGTLAGWAALNAANPDRTRLIVGPWAHLPWSRSLAGTDFGEEAISDIDRAQIAWFDHWLKGKSLDGAPVRLFDLGSLGWQEREDFPGTTQQLYLGGEGRASVDPAAGWLAGDPGDPGDEVLVHDPWRPAPSHGGRLGSPPGPADRREVDQRGDVLTFTGPALEAPLTLCGWIGATIHAEADAPSFDLHCVLSRVTPFGAVQTIATGAKRVEHAGGIAAVAVDLKASCVTLWPGERLRLSIAGASYPAFAVNPGEGDYLDVSQIDARIITIVVHHGAGHPSSLSYSVVDPAAASSEKQV